MSERFVLGENQLDLSLLGEVTNKLDIATTKDHVKEGATDEVLRLRNLIETIHQTKQAEKVGGYNRFFIPGTPYGPEKLPKHAEFINSTSRYRQVYLSGGNRVGKTLSMAWMTARHLTGDYPDWYKGRRFTHPIDAWAAGDFNQTTRDIIQLELMGKFGEWGTGMIPKENIVRTTSKSGVAGAIDTVYVKHKSGGTSTLQFKAYKQQNESFYGTAKHWIWLDELPPFSIYSECFTRTATTNGIIVVTATPLEGMTEMVFNFYSEADFLPEGIEPPAIIKMAREEHQRKIEEAKERGEFVQERARKKAVICIGWDDAPWMSEEEKVEQLANCPENLRSARSKGLPGDSGGKIYPIMMNDLVIDDFPIPNHWKLLNAVDPGWHNTGGAFGALDPDTDTLYIYADYKRGQAETLVHAEAIKTKSKWADAPVIFDYAGMGGRSEENQIRTQFRKHGLKLINADKAVMAGIAAVWERMSTGKLKIFRSCKMLQQEIITYQCDANNKPIKENDHIVDCLRYICMGIKHARTQSRSMHSTQNFGRMRGNLSGRRYY